MGQCPENELAKRNQCRNLFLFAKNIGLIYLMPNGNACVPCYLNLLGGVGHAAMNAKFSMASSMSCEQAVNGKTYRTIFTPHLKLANAVCSSINAEMSGRKF